LEQGNEPPTSRVAYEEMRRLRWVRKQAWRTSDERRLGQRSDVLAVVSQEKPASVVEFAHALAERRAAEKAGVETDLMQVKKMAKMASNVEVRPPIKLGATEGALAALFATEDISSPHPHPHPHHHPHLRGATEHISSPTNQSMERDSMPALPSAPTLPAVPSAAAPEPILSAVLPTAAPEPRTPEWPSVPQSVPNEAEELTQVEVINDGGMPSPAGGEVQVVSYRSQEGSQGDIQMMQLA